MENKETAVMILIILVAFMSFSLGRMYQEKVDKQVNSNYMGDGYGPATPVIIQ